jgi:hypothetical protein
VELLLRIWTLAFEDYLPFSASTLAQFDITRIQYNQSKLFQTIAPALLSSLHLRVPETDTELIGFLKFKDLLRSLHPLASHVKTVQVDAPGPRYMAMAAMDAAAAAASEVVNAYPSAWLHVLCHHWSEEGGLLEWLDQLSQHQIDELSLKSVYMDEDDVNPEGIDAIRILGGLKALTLSNVHFANAGLFLGPFLSLRSLQIKDMRVGEGFLQSVSANLEHLEYDCVVINDCDLPLFRDIGRLGSLKSLRLSFSWCASEAKLNLASRAVSSVLRDLEWLPQLRRFEFGDKLRIANEDKTLSDLCAKRGVVFQVAAA